MAPQSHRLDNTYAKYMRNHPYGRALYTPLPLRQFHPGSCGYFDSTGSWTPIVDLALLQSPHNDHTTVVTERRQAKSFGTECYTPLREPLEFAVPESNIEWGPKASENVKAQQIALNAGVSGAAITAAASGVPVPVDVSTQFSFSTTHSGGALLLTKPPIVHEKVYFEAPFKEWVKENAERLVRRRPEILEAGLWIVTSVWATDECAIQVWSQAGRAVDVGFDVGVMGVGELGPSGGWSVNAQDGGWVKYTATKDDRGMVVFFGGLKFKYRKLPIGQKLKMSPKNEIAYRRSGLIQGHKARLPEVAVPRDDEQPFGYAVDCERILDRASRDEMSEVEFMFEEDHDFYDHADPLIDHS